MKNALEDISSVKKRLKVEVLPEVVTAAREKAIHEIQKEANIPGFRPGKAPKEMVVQKFLKEIQKITIEGVVDQTLLPACNEVNVRPISAPEIEPGLWQAAGGFSYHATFEVLPEIKITEKNYKGLKLEKEEVEVSSEEIEKEIERLQQALTQLEPLPDDTIIADGLVAILDYTGKLDGKPFKSGEAKDFSVEIGSGNLLKDFEAGLKGAKKGETRALSFSYPNDYFNKELAGKKGEFNVTVKSVRKKAVPKLDDDFAKDLGNYKNMEEVRADAKKKIAAAKENEQTNHCYNAIVKNLTEEIKFDVPEALVHNELHHMINELAKDLSAQGQDINKLDRNEVVKTLQPNAEFRVKSFLILNHLCELLKIEVKEEEMDARLENVAKSAQRPLPEIKAYYEKNRLMAPLRARITHEKVLELVLNEAKIKVVKPKSKKK